MTGIENRLTTQAKSNEWTFSTDEVFHAGRPGRNSQTVSLDEVSGFHAYLADQLLAGKCRFTARDLMSNPLRLVWLLDAYCGEVDAILASGGSDRFYNLAERFGK